MLEEKEGEGAAEKLFFSDHPQICIAGLEELCKVGKHIEI